MRRWRRSLVWVVALVLALPVALALGLAWRLAAGPIALPRLTGRLERALSRGDGSMVVRIATTELAWDGREHEIDLVVHDLRLLAGGAPLLELPVASLKFAAWPLLTGRLVLRAVEVPDPHVTVRRDADGALQVGVGDVTSGASSLPDLLPPLVDPARSGPLAELRRIEVLRGEVVALPSDHREGWRLTGLELLLRRDPRGLGLEATGRLEVAGHAMPLRLTAAYDAPPGVATATIVFERADPAVLATLLDPSVTPVLLSQIDLRLDGTVKAALDAELRVREMHYELQAPRDGVRVVGRVEPSAVPVTFAATVTGEVLALKNVDTLWPAPVASGLRAWVTSRVGAGHVRDVRVAVDGRVTEDSAVDLETVAGGFHFDGLTVRPLDGVPPLTGVAGRARFDRTRWQFEIARAQTAGVDVAHATAELTGVGSAVPRVAIQATVRGPLERALALAGAYGGDATLAQAAVTGSLEATLTLGMPLGGAVDLARDAAASGRLRALALPRLVGDRSLTDGEFTFEVVRQVLALRGQARIEGVPVDLVVSQPLGGDTRQVDVTARLGSAERAALGFDLRPWMDGVVPVRAAMTMAKSRGAATVSADLGPAVLSAPKLGIEKKAGIPGTAEARLVLEGVRVTGVEDAVLRYGGTHVRGRAGLDQSGTVRTLRLDGTLGPTTGRKSPARVTLDVTPKPAARALVATADDVDVLFDALGLPADGAGGRLRFDGTLPPGPGVAIDGHLEAREFRITHAPLLARLLAMASIPGFTSVLRGSGLAVTRLAAGIRYQAAGITIEDGVLESPSLGMRFAGTIVGGDLDFRGSLVPSYYGLNTLAGRVPLLGTVITGSKQKGLQVFEFAVRGTTAAPKVTVDPISSLAPGAVRDLLNLLPRPALPRLRR